MIMENLVILNETKNDDIEFELNVEGVDTKDMRVLYILETKEYSMAFKCQNKNKNTWSVTIPPLPHIEPTSYKYHIDVITDGYYFEPLKGVANIEKSHQIYASKPEISAKQEKDKKVIQEGKKSTYNPPPKQRLSNVPTIADIADRIVKESHAFEDANGIEKKTDASGKRRPNDDVIMSILSEIKGKRVGTPQHAPKSNNSLKWHKGKVFNS